MGHDNRRDNPSTQPEWSRKQGFSSRVACGTLSEMKTSMGLWRAGAALLVLGSSGCFEATPEGAKQPEFTLRDAGHAHDAAGDAATLRDAAADAGSSPSNSLDSGAGNAGSSGSSGGSHDAGARCGDVARDSVLVSATHESGFCANSCKAMVTISAAASGEPSGCDAVTLLDCLTGGQCKPTNTGTLTPHGHDLARSIAAQLVGVTLADTYGCPGCTDGPTTQITLTRNGTDSSHKFGSGQAPNELMPSDAYFTSLFAALTQCKADGNITPDANCNKQ